MEIKHRIDRLRRKFPEKEIDAVLVSQPDNLFYLSGCEGLEGYLLVNGKRAIAATDFRYLEQAERQSPHCDRFRISGKMTEWLPNLLADTSIRRLGFESSHISFAGYKQIADILKSSHPEIELVPVEGLVESLRIIKDQDEIKNIELAAKITDAVLDQTGKLMQPGITELELAWEIEKFMRDHGSQPVPFDLIVAGGPNAALPHAKPGNYVIKDQDPVVIDIGSKVNNYGSDLTRTPCMGKPDETFKKIYSIVLDAQMAAIGQIKRGMTGAEADAIARKVIADAGYGEAFGHSLGHGIGLVTHEKPTLSPNSNDILTEGMVFTVEPGIYVSGWGGVRIEDDVVIENGKLRVISSTKKVIF